MFIKAKFEDSLVKSEQFAVSLRKKKKQEKISQIRAKRVYGTIINNDNVMVVDEDVKYIKLNNFRFYQRSKLRFSDANFQVQALTSTLSINSYQKTPYQNP